MHCKWTILYTKALNIMIYLIIICELSVLEMTRISDWQL